MRSMSPCSARCRRTGSKPERLANTQSGWPASGRRSAFRRRSQVHTLVDWRRGPLALADDGSPSVPEADEVDLVGTVPPPSKLREVPWEAILAQATPKVLGTDLFPRGSGHELVELRLDLSLPNLSGSPELNETLKGHDELEPESEVRVRESVERALGARPLELGDGHFAADERELLEPAQMVENLVRAPAPPGACDIARPVLPTGLQQGEIVRALKKAADAVDDGVEFEPNRSPPNGY